MRPGLVLAGAGFGLVFAPIGATAIDAAPDPDRGIAAAMTLVFRLLGMTIGISMLTAIAVRRLQGLVATSRRSYRLPVRAPPTSWRGKQHSLRSRFAESACRSRARRSPSGRHPRSWLFYPVAFSCQPPIVSGDALM